MHKKKNFDDGQGKIDFLHPVQNNAEMSDLVEKLQRYVHLRKHPAVMPVRTTFDSATDFESAIENYHERISELEFLTQWLTSKKAKLQREYFDEIVAVHPELKYEILGFGVTKKMPHSHKNLARAFNQYQ
jgi:hypothetical protein